MVKMEIALKQWRVCIMVLGGERDWMLSPGVAGICCGRAGDSGSGR